MKMTKTFVFEEKAFSSFERVTSCPAMTLTYFLMNDRNVDGYGQVNEEEEEALF